MGSTGPSPSLTLPEAPLPSLGSCWKRLSSPRGFPASGHPLERLSQPAARWSSLGFAPGQVEHLAPHHLLESFSLASRHLHIKSLPQHPKRTEILRFPTSWSSLGLDPRSRPRGFAALAQGVQDLDWQSSAHIVPRPQIQGSPCLWRCPCSSLGAHPLQFFGNHPSRSP